MRDSHAGPTRFDEFRQSLGIAPTMLTNRLAKYSLPAAGGAKNPEVYLRHGLVAGVFEQGRRYAFVKLPIGCDRDCNSVKRYRRSPQSLVRVAANAFQARDRASQSACNGGQW
ncbi:hypothetical protein DEV91_12653 [Phyllobacterium brassicacearum]|nr:hypothetical protein DEV91_12653 [Phyllobacterium brassicacearum]